MYGCDEQIDYVPGLDRRTYPAYNLRLRASVMSQEQYRTYCALYVDRSQAYVRSSGMYRSISPRPTPVPILHVDYDAREAYKSYALREKTEFYDSC